MESSDPTIGLRRNFYLLLGTVAVCIVAAKIVGSENVVEPSRYAPATQTNFGYDRAGKPERKWPASRPEPTPMFGSNDRSRWATVRSLVDEGTYVVGRREADPKLEVNAAFGGVVGYSSLRLKTASTTPPGLVDRGIIFEDGYQSLDKVMIPETGEFYSSKPPLLTTLIAGEYWLLKKCFGWSIVRDRWLVVCTILLTVNVLPFAIYLLLLAKLIDRFGTTDFGKLLTFTTACVGTFLTTFATTLNNHSPATFAVVFALYPLLRPRPAGGAETRWDMLVSGFFAGLVPTMDLPAAAFSAALLVPLLYVRPRRTLFYFVPAMLVPIAALFVCNHAALGRFLPAYSDFGGPMYEFAGSHWDKLKLVKQGIPQKGIDFADEPKGVYTFHLLLGHHGWFSLTPVFFGSLVGIIILVRRSIPSVRRVLTRKLPADAPIFNLPIVGAMTAVTSLVVMTYFVFKTNNYGGFTSGPRWFFWMIPLWLIAGLLGLDRIGRGRAGRLSLAILLGFSVFAVFYPAWNPWRPPWILQAFERLEWVNYDVLPG